MQPKRPRFNPLILALALAAVLMIWSVLGTSDSSTGGSTMSYSTVVHYFENNQVTAFTLDRNTSIITLTLKEGKQELPETTGATAATQASGGLLSNMFSSSTSSVGATRNDDGTVTVRYKLPYAYVFIENVQQYIDSYDAANPTAPMEYDYTTLISDTSKAFIKPNSEYWFGTDNLGRDYWCQVWYATQVSIRLALIVAVGESILGVIIGLIWGYVRSLDRFFTELYNLIDNLPYIIYMTLIALMVGQSFWIMAISMIAINWLSMARRVRNMVFMFRDREYNLASRCLGTPLWRVLTKNILPYLVSVIILRMALSIPGTINLESTLSYLGLGLGIDTPSLGLILSKVRGFFLDYPYLLVFPASIVSIISISFYIMGNALSDAADPRNHV